MSTPAGPGVLSASQLTWKLIFINYCLKLLCWALKLACLANNYAVLVMFSTLFRNHQQSAMFGCCAGFVWKWHPAFSKLWPGGSCSRGYVNTNFPQARFISEMCCCLSPADVTHGRSPHLIWFSFQGWMLWTGTNFTACKSCGDYPWTQWEKREGVCASTKVEKQQKENSLEEGKLRQTGCSEIKVLTNLAGQWSWAVRGKGWDDTLNGKDAAQGISLVSCLHTSAQWCNLRGPCLDGHGAQLAAGREGRALSLILMNSRSEGDSQEGGGWVAKYWKRKRIWGVRRCLGRSWRSLKLRWEKIASSKSFGVSLLAHTGEPAALEAVPASLQENLNGN